MYIVEVAGVFSSGKSTLIKKILKHEDVILVQQILPIWFILRFLKESVFQNLVIEGYFLLRYNLKIFINIKKVVCFDISSMSLMERVNLCRSVIRKLGYIFIINKERKRHIGKFLMVDEGFYQLVQNSVTLSDDPIDWGNLFNFNYEPDLLIITIASSQNIYSRSKSRINLTSRFKKLSEKNLLEIINKSIYSFKQLSVFYTSFFECDFRTLESLTFNDIKTKGVILLKNE